MELNQETLKKAYNYLSKDPCLDHLINKFSKNIDISERFNENYPLALSYLIIEQQVSFKAAITIKKRFIEKVKNLSNDEIIQLSDKDLQEHFQQFDPFALMNHYALVLPVQQP